MLADFWAYLFAVCSNWVVIMTTASPFVLDELLKRIWPKFRIWFEKTISPKNRRRWEIAIMLVGFFAANFLAFEDEHTKRLASNANNKTLASKLEAQSPSGQEQQVAQLQSQLDGEIKSRAILEKKFESLNARALT